MKSKSVGQRLQLKSELCQKAAKPQLALAKLQLQCLRQCQSPTNLRQLSRQALKQMTTQLHSPVLVSRWQAVHCPQRLHSPTLKSCQRLRCLIRSKQSETQRVSVYMYSKNQTRKQMTGIAKILCHSAPFALQNVVRNDIANTLCTLCRTNCAKASTVCAHLRKWVQKVFENIGEVESSKRLKIRVSVVRFHSRPPDSPHSFARGCGVFLFGFTVLHTNPAQFQSYHHPQNGAGLAE